MTLARHLMVDFNQMKSFVDPLIVVDAPKGSG